MLGYLKSAIFSLEQSRGRTETHELSRSVTDLNGDFNWLAILIEKSIEKEVDKIVFAFKFQKIEFVSGPYILYVVKSDGRGLQPLSRVSGLINVSGLRSNIYDSLF
jgi:hypothetical protein